MKHPESSRLLFFMPFLIVLLLIIGGCGGGGSSGQIAPPSGAGSASIGCGNYPPNASNPYSCCAIVISGVSQTDGGNCTWWAWAKTFDTFQEKLPGWGNAGTWLDAASAVGYAISALPEINTLAVKKSSPYKCGNTTCDYGHVAWVENVLPSGNLYISEMNCNTSYAATSREVTPTYFDGFIKPKNWVITPSLASITVATNSMVNEGLGQITATGIFSDGTTSDVTTQVTWDSTAPAVIQPYQGTGNFVAQTLSNSLSSTAIITASLKGITSQSITITVNKQVANPTIAASPMALNFNGTNTAPQSLSISNTAGGTLNYNLTTNVSWITFSATTGFAPANVLVSVNPNTAGLVAGINSGVITVSAPNSSNVSQSIQVNFNYSPTTTCSPPAAPMFMRATPFCKVNLATVDQPVPAINQSWSASAGATSYNLYRDNILIGRGYTSPIGTDMPLLSGYTYRYALEAVNSCGSSISAPVSISLPSDVCTLIEDTDTVRFKKFGPMQFFWTSAAGGLGNGQYTWTLHSSVLSNKVQWRPSALASGSYVVFVSLPTSPSVVIPNTVISYPFTRSAQYKIWDNGMLVGSYPVDQSFNQGWFMFAPVWLSGINTYVELGDVTGEPSLPARAVTFDAVLFAKQL